MLISACGGKTSPHAVDKSSTGNAALDDINNKISADPGNASLYADRAAIFLEYNNYDNALSDLEKAITLDSMQPAFYSLLTDVYIGYFKSWQGLRVMNKAAELFPEHIPTLLKLGRTQLLLRLNAESMKTIDKILTMDPANADAYLLLGMNFKETGDTARAINSFQKAVNFNADLIDAWINLGQLHETRGHAVAVKYYNSAVEIAPKNVLALHAKADFLSRTNDLSGALAIYRDIAAIDSTYEEAYYNSGLLYLDLDSVPQAYRQFDQAIQASPLHVRAYYFRGYCAEIMGDKDQAKNDYSKALSFSPDYPAAQQGLKRLDQSN